MAANVHPEWVRLGWFARAAWRKMTQAVTEDFGREGIEDARTSGSRIHAGDLGGRHLGRRLLQPERQLIELYGGRCSRRAWPSASFPSAVSAATSRHAHSILRLLTLEASAAGYSRASEKEKTPNQAEPDRRP